ncbi:phage major capsid protein [Demequina lutea]|uniref:HK97 family phage major capsid protein n=1 Tax=Demequina lutea TaxID=431489 RepID=A0A7Y9ZDA8_9MICO|nr:phage major capsid protein [Demequina lutea]NYI41246.1 HK97 family phage major capsid protein [Demequina lutea]
MTIIDELKSRRAGIKAKIDSLTADPNTFTPAVEAKCTALVSEVRGIDQRIADLSEQDAMEQRANGVRIGPGVSVRTTTGGVPLKIQDRPRAETYTRNGEFSFFADVLASSRQDKAASERLIANQEAQGRALTTVAGAGGNFAPPLWLVEDYVKFARPGRVAADLAQKHELPYGVSSINLPKVASGTSVGTTVTQNTAVSNTDITSTSVSSGIVSISGQQVLSLQLLNQGGAAMDQIILQDLALASAQMLELQVLSGTGSNGQLRGLDSAGGTAVTFTTTAPSVVSTVNTASFYFQVIKAANTVSSGRFLPADAILMHPRRWAWVSAGLDLQNRPLISDGGVSFNTPGTVEAIAASGRVGTLASGIPVYTSPSIATNLGTATNQDKVYILRSADIHLWESGLELKSFDATYADQNSLLLRALSYAAYIPDRYTESVVTIEGTGLVDPGLG